MSDEAKSGCLIASGVLFVLLLCGGGVGGCMYYGPQYTVYHQRLAGSAKLAEAESSKQILIQDAHAKMESAKLLAQAEVERARGVAEANKIIGDSLNGNEAYLWYLWIHNLEVAEGRGSTVIYVPTESQLPVMEAGRFHQRFTNGPAENPQ